MCPLWSCRSIFSVRRGCLFFNDGTWSCAACPADLLRFLRLRRLDLRETLEIVSEKNPCLFSVLSQEKRSLSDWKIEIHQFKMDWSSEAAALKRSLPQRVPNAVCLLVNDFPSNVSLRVTLGLSFFLYSRGCRRLVQDTFSFKFNNIFTLDDSFKRLNLRRSVIRSRVRWSFFWKK